MSTVLNTNNLEFVEYMEYMEFVEDMEYLGCNPAVEMPGGRARAF